MEKKARKKIVWKEIGWEKILLLVLAGVILLAVNVQESRDSGDTAAATEEETGTDTASANDIYLKNMEKKLENILRKVEGVGRVDVMITLKSSATAVLNKDISEETEEDGGDGEEDGAGSRSSRKEEETVLADAAGEDAPYVISTVEPEIAGVVIACEGAGNNVTAQAVKEAAEVLFDMEPNHIKVLKMEESE